jgi:hypothetical protein
MSKKQSKKWNNIWPLGAAWNKLAQANKSWKANIPALLGSLNSSSKQAHSGHESGSSLASGLRGEEKVVGKNDQGQPARSERSQVLYYMQTFRASTDKRSSNKVQVLADKCMLHVYRWRQECLNLKNDPKSNLSGW